MRLAKCGRHRVGGKDACGRFQDNDQACTCAPVGTATVNKSDCLDIAVHAGLTGGSDNDVVAEVRHRFKK